MAAMTPAPPKLTQLTRYTPEQLFTIVKHGIKFTGMPAWPALGRDDEVWAVVAFLRRMPALDAARYRRLAFGEPPQIAGAPPAVVRDICSRCHGVDGIGRGPGAFPNPAGQRAADLYGSLRAFADRTRFSGIMSGIAANLSDGSMREVASYYERLSTSEVALAGESAASDRGAAIATRGIP